MGGLLGNAQRLSDGNPGATGLDGVSDHDDEPFIRFITKLTNKPDMVCWVAQLDAARFGEQLHGHC